jgi:tight adherence protein B
MTALALAALAAIGVWLTCTARRSSPPAPRAFAPVTIARRLSLARRLERAGLGDVDHRELAAVAGVLGLVGAAAGWIVFAGVFPAFVLGAFAASFPLASARMRAHARRARALDAWPRLIEEIRVQTGSLGRSIPQALFEVGARAPEELRPAFEAAHREWLLSTDFVRTIGVLKPRLADATADMVCETLLVAHELGGSEIDRRLQALAEDRAQDSQGRKDARSRQAGARFARRFVLIVPFGMALAGMSLGEGRAAYRGPTGQVLVVVAIGVVVLCWAWAGRIMRLPAEDRVFDA